MAPTDRAHAPSGFIKIHMELSKARLSLLVLVTTLVGYLMATGTEVIELGRLIATLIGTAAVAAGANGLNQWWEISRDAAMERTRNRPLPSGRMGRQYAMWWSTWAAAVGLWLLFFEVHVLTGMLALANLLIYVLVYTPMKPRTTFCTLVGAVCGAIPPAIGWTAVTGTLDPGAWILAAILFIWQIPHFMSLAWMYREDYRRGGFCMLPVVDTTGRMTCRVIVIYSLALIPVCLAATIVGLSGYFYAFGSLLTGLGFLWLCLQFIQTKTDLNARRVFLASLLFLPLVLGLMLADQLPPPPDGIAIQFVEANDTAHQDQDSPSLQMMPYEQRNL